MTDDDEGALREEYYGRVMEVRGQILTKQGRFQHAVFLHWRPDKTADMLDGYELKADLEDLGFKFGSDEADLFS
jgi:ATP-dependent DNA ligase